MRDIERRLIEVNSESEETDMKKDNCIFCRIANGEIPTNTLYEDDMFRVILDVGPVTKGHALILPKDHADNLYELPDEIGEKVLPLARKMAVRMKEKLQCQGFNLMQNNGEAAGQTVNHFHVHLLPRYEGGEEIMCLNQGSPSAEELAAVKELITED